MKWEYKTIKSFALNSRHSSIDEELNHLGQDGWELVASSPLDGYLHFFFKRPKPTKARRIATRASED